MIAWVATQPSTAPYGMDFGRDIEPAGRYLNVDESADLAGYPAIPGWETGYVRFDNPLVLEHLSTTSTGWKRTLSRMYGGKTGKELSDAIKADGYDAVVTYDEYGLNETVDLGGKTIGRDAFQKARR